MFQVLIIHSNTVVEIESDNMCLTWALILLWLPYFQFLLNSVVNIMKFLVISGIQYAGWSEIHRNLLTMSQWKNFIQCSNNMTQML